MSNINLDNQYLNKSMRILAIDDYKPILQLYELAFSEHFNIELANNFIEVQKISNKKEIKFIITDYNFPDMSFENLILYVKQNFQEAKIILISGTDKLYELKETYKNDCLAVLAKPIDLIYVIDMIKNYK